MRRRGPVRWSVVRSRHHGRRGWLVHARSGPDNGDPGTRDSRWCETEAEARSLQASLAQGLTFDAAQHVWQATA